MESAVQYLGMEGLAAWQFWGLTALALVTNLISAVAGTAGGLILLAVMAFVFPPALLIPIHTVVQLGAAGSMALTRWRYLMRDTVAPFIVGTAIGAAAGARVFVSLEQATLQLILALSILLLTWVPRLARFGPDKGRFLFVGFLVTFLGVFISATGTLLATFTAAVAPDRRNHIATVGVLMVFVHVAKLLAFGAIGMAFAAYAPLMAAMIVTSMAGAWLGRPLLDRVPERAFRIAFHAILTLLALRLMWIALAAG